MSAAEEFDPVDAVRADIEETRAELAETVSELSDRLNPKVRAAAAVDDLTTQARQLTEGRQAQIVGGVAVFAVLLIGWRLWRRRR